VNKRKESRGQAEREKKRKGKREKKNKEDQVVTRNNTKG